MILAALLLMSVSVTMSMAEANPYDRYRNVFESIPALPPIPADNPVTEARMELGKMLYWDRRSSKTGQTSCGFCHHPAYYGAEPMD